MPVAFRHATGTPFLHSRAIDTNGLARCIQFANSTIPATHDGLRINELLGHITVLPVHLLVLRFGNDALFSDLKTKLCESEQSILKI
jgi:hypothetical protein